jgi:nucleoid-associated protein YgaU
MSLFKFLKDAGEKLFGGKDAQAATPAPAAASAPAPAASAGTATPASPASAPSGSQRAAEAITGYIQTLQLPVKNLQVSYDGASATVTVKGEAADQATREKVVLSCGNVAGVEQVKDEMTVAQPAADTARFYTVASGDTLSKIAKQMYGNANDYMKIFEANKPMLKHPDKIYPGQVLRVPN